VVSNTLEYERVETIRALKGTVDIYLTDLKYAEADSAARYSFAADYPQVARAALSEMVEAVGAPVLEKGLLHRGVIVRLLVLPTLEHEAMMNLRYLRKTYGDRIIVSLMNQYTPDFADPNADRALHRRLTTFEYQSVLNEAIRLGFAGYLQEASAATTAYTPDFSQSWETRILREEKP